MSASKKTRILVIDLSDGTFEIGKTSNEEALSEIKSFVEFNGTESDYINYLSENGIEIIETLRV